MAMKRMGTLVASAAVFVLLTAVPALACTGSACNPRPGGGPGVSGAGGTAFTGANVSAGLIYLVALAVVGTLAIFISRHRAAATN